jgi:hypothetical protein
MKSYLRSCLWLFEKNSLQWKHLPSLPHWVISDGVSRSVVPVDLFTEADDTTGAGKPDDACYCEAGLVKERSDGRDGCGRAASLEAFRCS